MKEYPAEIKIIRHGDKEYLQVARNVRLPDGRITTKVIRSYGRVTDEKLRLAQELASDINHGLTESNAPMLKINPAYVRSLHQGPVLGIFSPEATPLAWDVFWTAWKNRIEEMLKSKGLRETIRLTQPDLKTEGEVERFHDWIQDKPDDEKIRILAKRWYYP